MDFITFHWLQWFGEGGDGGDAGVSEGAPQAEADSGEGFEQESEKARIPERAKGAFKKAYEKTHPSAPKEAVNETVQTAEEPTHIPYSELIKSDEYKAEHKAYMDKTIADRFKRYDGLEQRYAKMQQTMGIVGQKYGLDPNDPNYAENLQQAVSKDDTYFEDIAMQNDMSVEQARRNYEMEQKLHAIEAQERMRQQQEENRQAMQTLMANAEQTKAMFPGFDLDAEMQNEKFRRLLFATQGDTTAAYQALHWNELVQQKVAAETTKAKQAITNSIASGQRRPTESGLSNSATGVVSTAPSYKGMNSKQMREYAMSHFR